MPRHDAGRKGRTFRIGLFAGAWSGWFPLIPVGKRVQGIYREYPSQFWLLIGASFIDAIGGAMLFPFLTLYITSKFDLGMTQVGLVFGIFSIASVFGSTIGGALSDQIGRKGMVIFGLVASALSSLVMGVADTLAFFLGAALFAGLFANAGGPARQAMIADLLPEEKRAQGFGVFRVVHNLAVVIGPAIGGLLAAASYLFLFASDAVTSVITAGIAVLYLRETKPTPEDGQTQETAGESLKGYGRILRDTRFLTFMIASMLMVLVYMQMNGTLAVYLRDFHGVSEQGFGTIISLNAAMVVVFQFAISRRIEGLPPFLVMAVGTMLLVVGFGMYGFVGTYPLFMLAMVIITLGEMLFAPVGQALVASLSPDDMRGRYMAAYGFAWIIPSAAGITLAGLIMDNFNPDWVWYAAAVVGTISAAVYFWMHRSEPETRVQLGESEQSFPAAVAEEETASAA